MFIKSIHNFRTSIKLEKPDSRNNRFIDEHFIGTYNSEQIKGFFGMYHGIKDRPDKYLRSTAVNVAADEQAIYEFMQNAVDCKSTHFFIFYNESFFLAINNGAPFNDKDVKAILNLGQSDKGNAEIGSYGVGFKLAHRLIGKDDGIDELIKEYKGPVVFSWSKFREFEEFLDNKITVAHFNKEKPEYYNRAAWLFKICLTNFPTNPGETVKDLDYLEKVLFTTEELSEVIGFVKENLDKHTENINYKVLQQGSLFFLRLGEGKKKYIDNNYSEIQRGIEYSLNTLSELQKVYINDQYIEKKKLTTIEYIIPKETSEFIEIAPKNKERDIKIKFGYDFRYWESDHFLNAPNFYDYFPMESERHNFRFMLHCNAFDKMVNRRELQKGNINSKLLSSVIQRLLPDFESFKTADDNKKFLSVFASILLSDHGQTPWIENELFSPLCTFLKENIPTQVGFSDLPENVKIKNTAININPSDIGLPDINWFYWNEKNNKDIIDQAAARDKLALKKWDIIDLLSFAIDRGNVEEINSWVKQANEAHMLDPEKKDWTYINFLKEIDEKLTETNFKKISQIKLIKFSDRNYYSFNEVFANPELVFITEKITNIKHILHDLGLTTSLLDISKNPKINEIVASKFSDLKLFIVIAEKTKTNSLKPIQKQNLFIALKDFYGVDIKRLGSLELFWDTQKMLKPLNQLIKAGLEVPSWLFPYKINKFEYIKELDNYLVAKENIYSKIIYEEWDNIVPSLPNLLKSIKDFYVSVISYYEADQSSLTLDDKNCIYDGEAFKHPDDIFYHSILSEVSDYNSVRSGILKLTSYNTPVKYVLEFLTKEPFSIKEDKLKNKIQDAEFSVNESLALLDFATKEGTDLFEFGHFTENEENLIGFVVDKTTDQYYASNQLIVDFISENLSSQFKLLPKSLSAYKLKVLRNVELQDEIISQLGYQLDDHANSLLDFLTGTSLDSFYKKVKEFKVSVKEKYDKSDFEYKLFANIPEDQIEDFNSKLIICDGDREFAATEISNIDKFKIDGISLTLSKILPDNPLNENASIVTSVIKALNKAGIPKHNLESVFDIEKEPDEDWLKEMIDTLLDAESHILENPEQLAFVLLYHKNICSLSLSTIKIHRLDGQNDTLNDTWYSQNISFITENATLAEQYFGINKILNLSPDKPLYDFDSESRILFQPYFDIEESKFVCDYLDKNLSEEENIDLFNFIYNFWTVSQANKRLIGNIDWNLINEIEIEKIIGFTPASLIWDENIGLDSEQCPAWLKTWADSDEKEDFLSDIGINMNNSHISQLRKSFITSSLFPEKLIPNNDNLSSELLINTLDWIVEKQIEITEESRFNLLLVLANEVEISFDEAFDFETLESSEEWDAEYYKEWKNETESDISIFLYEGKMPILVLYNGNTIWSKSDCDYAFNSDNDYLYINSNVSRIENILEDVEQDEDIPFDQELLKQLYKAKNNSSSLIASDEVARIIKENQILKQELNEIKSLQPPDENGYRRKGRIDPEAQKAINLEARKMVKKLLEQFSEFDCSEWDPEQGGYVVQNKVKKNDEYIDIVVVSASSSPVHLSPFAFNILARNPNNQLFVRDHSGIHNVTFDDIFHENQSVNMVFDTNFVPNTVLAQLAEVFNYVSNTKFVIENPHFSFNSMLTGFGLNNINSGDAFVPNDDDQF